MSPTVLVLCTANRCRSPMAGVLLRRAFTRAGMPVSVETAGFLPGGQGTPDEVGAALARTGVDLSRHSSRTVTSEMIAASDLVLGMERSHVRQVVALDPGAWTRTFTLKELVRRGEHIGPRRSDETPEAWIADAHRGRRSAELLGADESDNVIDPMGGSQRGFDRTAEELDDLARRLATLLTPSAATASGG